MGDHTDGQNVSDLLTLTDIFKNTPVLLCPHFPPGADVNAFDVYSKTPLHLCCESLHYHGSAALLNHGADVTLTDSDDCEPLHLLCANGGVRIAQMLLETCAVDVNASSQIGTPLHLACKSVDGLSLLIK